MKGAVIEEPFMYAECYDDSVDFSPPLSHITRVNVELVCTDFVTVPVWLLLVE